MCFSLMLEINAFNNNIDYQQLNYCSLYLSIFYDIRIWTDNLSVINPYFTSEKRLIQATLVTNCTKEYLVTRANVRITNDEPIMTKLQSCNSHQDNQQGLSFECRVLLSDYSHCFKQNLSVGDIIPGIVAGRKLPITSFRVRQFILIKILICKQDKYEQVMVFYRWR